MLSFMSCCSQFTIGFYASQSGRSTFNTMCFPLDSLPHPQSSYKRFRSGSLSLWQWGVVVFPYLDSWLLKAPMNVEIQSVLRKAKILFNVLKHSTGRSQLSVPIQQIECIGAMLDTVTSRSYFLRNRFIKLTNLISQVQMNPQTMARIYLQLLGHMTACTFLTAHQVTSSLIPVISENCLYSQQTVSSS